MRAFMLRCIGQRLPEVGKYIVLMGWTLGGIKWELHARHELALMLLQCHSKEATQDHVVVSDVPGVLDGYILEQTTVCPKDVVHPGLHLLAATENAPYPSILRTRELAREKVFHHVLEYLRNHH